MTLINSKPYARLPRPWDPRTQIPGPKPEPVNPKHEIETKLQVTTEAGRAANS